ncbi:MAG TPA: glycine cleavage system protein GcvH [Longimicrobiales bacterium]|jgi:glycine cleavage system H protein
MAEIPPDLLYTEEHEYLKPTGEEGVYQVGITDYAQGELGDIVYVELPEEGSRFARMEPFGTVEAVKAVSDLYCPVAGEVVEVNTALDDDPALVNSDPYGEGWMIKLRIADESELDSLLGAAEYAAHIGESSE